MVVAVLPANFCVFVFCQIFNNFSCYYLTGGSMGFPGNEVLLTFCTTAVIHLRSQSYRTTYLSITSDLHTSSLSHLVFHDTPVLKKLSPPWPYFFKKFKFPVLFIWGIYLYGLCNTTSF